MIGIQASNLGKSFGRNFLFRNLNVQIDASERLAVLGPNGCGKSTLLQLLAGLQTPTEGRIQWYLRGSDLKAEQLFKYLSISAPYLELPEELSASQIISLQARVKPFNKSISLDDILRMSGLFQHRDKPVRTFSSGMKQRLKNLLAISADVPLLFLDEPCSNLDADGVLVFAHLLQQFAHEKTILVFSNHRNEEYPDFNKKISLR